MVQKGLLRKHYPSDLTDEQWAIVEPMIPPAKQNAQGGRPRKVDLREVLNTLFYLKRSGCQWDMLPHDLLPKVPSMTTLPSGATTGHGPRWSRPCANEPAWKRDTSLPPVPHASIANRSRPPKWGAPSAAMMGARKSKDASGICWSIRWACSWPSS